MGFRLDPSVSWGDVGMGIGIVLGGVLAFADLDARVDLAGAEIVHAKESTAQVAQALVDHKRESAAEDKAIRGEIRAELEGINAKLDRLIERELDRQGGGR